MGRARVQDKWRTAMNATCCPDHAALEAYLLGNVDDADLDAHLDECSACRCALDELDAAVNQPFAILRDAVSANGEWPRPEFQHLIADAKALGTSPIDGHSTLQV